MIQNLLNHIPPHQLFLPSSFMGTKVSTVTVKIQLRRKSERQKREMLIIDRTPAQVTRVRGSNKLQKNIWELVGDKEETWIRKRKKRP